MQVHILEGGRCISHSRKRAACGVHMCNWCWPTDFNMQCPADLRNDVFIHFLILTTWFLLLRRSVSLCQPSFYIHGVCLDETETETPKVGFEYVLKLLCHKAWRKWRSYLQLEKIKKKMVTRQRQEDLWKQTAQPELFEKKQFDVSLLSYLVIAF